MYNLEQLTSNLTAFNTQQNLFGVAKDEQIDIFSNDNKLLKSIQTYEGKIEKIYFIPDSAYLLSATKTGRVMLYNYRTKPFGFRLYSFVKQYKTQKQKKMTCAAFRDKRIAIGSNEGIILIFGLHTQKIQQTLQPTYSTICAMCFNSSNKLISAEPRGNIFIYDLSDSHNFKTIHTALYAIKQLLYIPNTHFIIINTGTKKLALLDSKNSKIFTFNYMNFNNDILCISLTQKGNLLVVLVDKTRVEIELQQAQKIHSLILHNMIIEAYQLIEKEPWLQNTSEYETLEKIYFTKYLNATKALINKDIEQAHKIIDDYILVESKKDDVMLLFNAYKEYENFVILSAEHKYAPAYALCNRFSPLKYSPQYKSMEKEFKQAYTFAQKAILSENYNLAKEYLSAYLTVLSKKEVINLILKYNKDFLKFLGFIKVEDYQNINILLTKYPIFYDIPPYIALKEKEQATLKEIKILINAANTTEALQKINMLQAIPSLSKKLEKLHSEAISVEQLMQSYEINDFKHCYEILDEKNHLFVDLELNGMLENHWKNLMHSCEEYALMGNIKGIKKTLQELITVKTRSRQIGDMLRLSFSVEIIHNLENIQYSTAQILIYSYIDIFGIDKEFKTVMKKYEELSNNKLAITTHATHRLPRDSWLHNELIVGNY
jgi:hypothetical protein